MRSSVAAAIRICGILLLTLQFAGTARAQSVLEFHGNPRRTGNYVVPALDWKRARGIRLDTGFAPHFSGRLYGQPLYWQTPAGGRLIVATEDDTVAAIDAASGATLWIRNLGRPAPLSDFSCGNIDPLGITGTPIIDRQSQTLYLDAMIAEASGPHHLVFGLSLANGSPLPGWPVDVGAALAQRGAIFNSPDQNQRGALAILGRRVFVPYGGHFGDCGDYHGWIVGIGITDPHDVVFWRTAARGGGIWAPGGIAGDGASLFVATGNTIGARRWSDGEAVFRLGPGLGRSDRPRDFFAPADWRTLDAEDADLGGTNSLPLDVPAASGVERLILALGKDARAYLLDRDNLGGLGGQLAATTVAIGPIRTAPAAYPTSAGVMVAFEGQGAECPDRGANGGLTVLKIGAGAPPVLATAWCAALDGGGAPIVTTTDGRSNPVVWVLGAEGDDRLHGFRGDNGEPLFEGGGPGDRMSGLHHFQTLFAASDRLYVGADDRVYAFSF